MFNLGCVFPLRPGVASGYSRGKRRWHFLGCKLAPDGLVGEAAAGGVQAAWFLRERWDMWSKQSTIRVTALLALWAFMIALESKPAAAQNQAESLSASFRKAAQRVAPALVGVRPMGVSRPLVSVPIPNVGPFRPTDFIPRGVLRNSNEIEFDTTGSGFIADFDRGIVVTSEGVLRGASQAVVVFSDGTDRVASQIRRDPRSDVAILVVDLKGLTATAVTWGESDAIEPGDWVLALGSAGGAPPSLSAGIFSARQTWAGFRAGMARDRFTHRSRFLGWSDRELEGRGDRVERSVAEPGAFAGREPLHSSRRAGAPYRRGSWAVRAGSPGISGCAG